MGDRPLFAPGNFLFYSVVAWTAPMFRESGDGPMTAGLLIASLTLASTSGNLSSGRSCHLSCTRCLPTTGPKAEILAEER
jgi:hypothetical protein